MSKIAAKQHVPIFVGSTFTDMVEYRKSAFDALSRLETIVRGMEYFGSKTDAPLDVCLETVRSCKLYVGIFGMRYGSIPDGFEESMTHLEYKEAVKNKLPALVYIINEDEQPILPKHVEVGQGAEKLSALKSILQNKHTCSYFTSPSDLASKLMHDVPIALAEIGAEVAESGLIQPAADHQALINDFLELPAMLKGEEVAFTFKSGSFRSTSADNCEALGLRVGATVDAYCTVNGSRSVYVYASGEVARTALQIEKESAVSAKGKTVFGTKYSSQWTDEGAIREVDVVKGIQITSIEKIHPKSDDK